MNTLTRSLSIAAISGGSKLSSRTAMKGLAITMGSMVAKKKASGLLSLPDLTYKLSSK